MYDHFKSEWNRDRIAEIRGEFHLAEFFCGMCLGAIIVIGVIFI